MILSEEKNFGLNSFELNFPPEVRGLGVTAWVRLSVITIAIFFLNMFGFIQGCHMAFFRAIFLTNAAIFESHFLEKNYLALSSVNGYFMDVF